MAEEEARRQANPLDFGAALNFLDTLAGSICKEITEAQQGKKPEANKDEASKKSESKENPEDQQAMDATEPKPSTSKSNEVVQETPKQVAPEAPKQIISKKFGTKISVNENMEKTEIAIQLVGHKFKPEDLEVQVLDGNVLLVKAEGEPKFERRFNLPAKSLVDKIESVFNMKEEDKQTLLIKIPKDLKVVQVPISLMEQ